MIITYRPYLVCGPTRISPTPPAQVSICVIRYLDPCTSWSKTKVLRGKVPEAIKYLISPANEISRRPDGG